MVCGWLLVHFGTIYYYYYYYLFIFPLLCFPSRPCSFCMNVKETKDKELLKNDNFIVSVERVLECPFFKWVVGGGFFVVAILK